ncbi:DgyrCDS11272 [Dimorphilus gyrociliatus]|uniref:DgyrCDS11272 n=1 Tax=Dimorphilus gyrociliatus TaxID=2664684 RepID=A0A7I8W2Z0_9ANNE|nr:DgyrCDS11272 [Dimorphilus gyrociliatus]
MAKKKFAVSAEGREGALAHEEVKLVKKRLKKLCCCGGGWIVATVLLLLVGILLLVYFTKYWNDETTKKRIFAYLGLALLLAGIVTGVVSGILCGLVYHVLKYSDRKWTAKTEGNKNRKKYKFGEAPYPQQPTEDTREETKFVGQVQPEDVKIES